MIKLRKNNRLKHYDYTQNGAYFVTVCSIDKKHIFGEVVKQIEDGFSVGANALVRPKMQLSKLGQCVEQTIKIQNKNGVEITNHVIMPNHIHMIIQISSDRRTGVSAPTISQIITNIKSFVTKQAKHPVWQKSFYDHVIRNEDDYQNIYHYIEHNVEKWQDDTYYDRH